MAITGKEAYQNWLDECAHEDEPRTPWDEIGTERQAYFDENADSYDFPQMSAEELAQLEAMRPLIEGFMAWFCGPIVARVEARMAERDRLREACKVTINV